MPSFGGDLTADVRLLGVSLDPVAGMVVLEIPNKERSVVRLADVWDARPEDPFNSELLFPAGMSTQNTPVWLSLRAIPHLLVAGTTGGGKSVFLHSLITSLVAKYSPYRLKLSLIDAKQGVEFGAYEPLSNYRFGCNAFDPESATRELYRLIQEMRERFDLMRGKGCATWTRWMSCTPTSWWSSTRWPTSSTSAPRPRTPSSRWHSSGARPASTWSWQRSGHHSTSSREG